MPLYERDGFERDPYYRTLVPTQPTTPYGGDATQQPTAPTPTTTAETPYGDDAVAKQIPKTTTTAGQPGSLTIRPDGSATAPDGVSFYYDQKTFSTFGPNSKSFIGIIDGDPKMDSAAKTWINSLAARAGIGDKIAYQTILESIPKMSLSPESRAALYKMLGIAAPAAPSGSGSGGSGGGSGGDSGGGGGDSRIPPPVGTLPPEGLIGAYPGNVGQPSVDWAQAILGGDFSNLPLYNEMTDPKYSDPTQNPYIQSMVGSLKNEMQEDWLGQQAALAEQAEAAGRYGSGLYQALSTRATEETQEALAQAISQMYSGAYENERQRRAGLLPQFLGAQQSAAQIPIQVGQLGVQQGQLGVQQGQLGINKGYLNLSKDQFAFQKKMGLLGAQQDAINAWMQMLLWAGSLGDTRTTNATQPYVPQGPSPNQATIWGGFEGYSQGRQLEQYWKPQGSTTPGVN